MDSWLHKFRIWLIGPAAHYKVGDTVQLKGTEHLMVVREVINKRTMPRAMLYCEWFESDTKQTRQNLFYEVDVTPYDWYRLSEGNLINKITSDQQQVEVKTVVDKF